MTDAELIHEYHRLFKKYAKDGIVDLDKRLRHKFSYQIHRTGDAIKTLKGVLPPNRQSQYFIALVTKGSGEKTIGQFSFPIRKNLLMVIPKRVIHSSKYWSLDCSGYALMFNVDFFLNNAFPKQHIEGRHIFKSSIRPYIIINDRQSKQMKDVFEFIIREHGEGERAKSEMIAVKILELLIQCDRIFTTACETGEESVYNPLIQQFNDLVDKHLSSERTVAFYASQLHVHPNHLNYLVRNHTGLSAKNMIDNKILQEAKYLLGLSGSSVKEVAHQLGFVNPAYFSSWFGRLSQQTPQAYKRSIL